MNYNIRMKMKFFVKSVLCLVMLTSLCCSCSDDSESWEELDAPTGEVLPKTDQLSVKLNLPTAVLGNNFKEAGSALVNRLTKNVSINDNSVRVVVLDNETALTIDGDMLEKVKQVYDKGGVIAITEPSKATMERLKNINWEMRLCTTMTTMMAMGTSMIFMLSIRREEKCISKI